MSTLGVWMCMYVCVCMQEEPVAWAWKSLGEILEEVKAALRSLQENSAARRAGSLVLKEAGEGPGKLGTSRGLLPRPGALGKWEGEPLLFFILVSLSVYSRAGRENQEFQEIQEFREI